MRSTRLRHSVFQIISFGIIWSIAGLVYSILEKGILGDLDHYPATGNPYNFEQTFLSTFMITGLLGLAFGALEALYVQRLFINMSLARKIILKTLLYLVVIALALVAITVLRDIDFGPEALGRLQRFFVDYAALSVASYIALITLVSLFYSEVSQNLGQTVLLNFLSGRYHTPREEERIFMFVDMKSSTTIAERIGHLKYFDMLRTYFANLSDAIVQNEGEIYQYVGDEIVISWRMKKGLKDAHCIQCFYDMKAALEKQKAQYFEAFGVAPSFKAGLHFGKVTTGEIGVIKKDIIFTGDVLNTTARIQALCNSHNVDLLISAPLLHRLDLSDRFKAHSLGESELRGRDEKMGLFTLKASA